jgi:hypothetical protein
MVKANFFKAIAAGIILYRVVKYIGQQNPLNPGIIGSKVLAWCV